MPGEGAAAMYSRLQSIPDDANAIVHQLIPKPISSQLPVHETPVHETPETFRETFRQRNTSAKLSSQSAGYTETGRRAPHGARGLKST
jgi:hypothetical protein